MPVSHRLVVCSGLGDCDCFLPRRTIWNSNLYIDQPIIYDLRLLQNLIRNGGRLQGDIPKPTRSSIRLPHGYTIEDLTILGEMFTKLLRRRAPGNSTDEQLRGLGNFIVLRKT
jgi:hypothetical protein